LRDLEDQVLVLAEPVDQGGGGLTGELGRRRIDHRQDRVQVVRKRLLEREVTLAPRQIGGNQLVDVGIDGEMLDSVNA
jgi:hypothetical protein